MSFMTMLEGGGAGAGGGAGPVGGAVGGAAPTCLGGWVLLVTGSAAPVPGPALATAAAPTPRSAQFWHCWTYSRVRWYVSCRMPRMWAPAPAPGTAPATPPAPATAPAPVTAAGWWPTCPGVGGGLAAATAAAFCRGVDWLMSWHWISVCPQPEPAP